MPPTATGTMPPENDSTLLPTTAIQYAHQATKLSLAPPGEEGAAAGTAIEAHYITPQDPIIITKDGGRLPGVPLEEAEKLNRLKDIVEGSSTELTTENSGSENGSRSITPQNGRIQKSGEGSLRRSMPPSRTNPLFPPMPLYGPSSFWRDVQMMVFRITSSILSTCFLGAIVLGAAFTSLKPMFIHIWLRLNGKDPDARRPFYEEEKKLKIQREEKARIWENRQKAESSTEEKNDEAKEEFIPTEGGPDPLVCDVGYYARRVGLDMETFKVQTEDGFIIELWHIYNPLEFTPMTEAERAARGPDVFTGAGPSRPSDTKKPKFPILMIHGLLQSSGAYCTNDDNSLAFYLCKSGYDVWLGNNRCGFNPEHSLLSYSDPRMWAWNIRQMGVMDLPALTSRVLSETGFEKLGLIAHSQGTTQTLVALAKEQRPDLGDKLTVACLLAPAAYAGPLIGKAYFKFMYMISPAFFRIIFGVHAFIPLMLAMHSIIPGKLFGAMGYVVFHFLFNWSDDRWDRGLRDRCFQFAPVYVSAESMRWWLGRECFAKQKCILATREEGHAEDKEDEMEDYYQKSAQHTNHQSEKPKPSSQHAERPSPSQRSSSLRRKAHKPKGSTAWYNARVPPFALWVAGSDDLVDGKRLLRRFERGREPHVRVVHSKVIEEYEHLDVIWAMDCIEKVGRELKEVLWRTCDVRSRCRVPVGCEGVEEWVDPKRGEDEAGNGNEKDEENEEDDSQSSSSDSPDEKDVGE